MPAGISRRTVFLTALVGLLSVCPSGSSRLFGQAAPADRPLPSAGATTTAPLPRVQTVRESQFRSRWTNPPVDRAPAAETAREQLRDADEGVLQPLRRSLHDLFRTGPLQIRGSLGLGYESTQANGKRGSQPSESGGSFVAAPAGLLTYGRQLGNVEANLAYSAGYLYYSGSTGSSASGGTENGFNQAARFDLGSGGLRSSVRNNLSLSSGQGQEIETGGATQRFNLTDSLIGSYQLSEFTQIAAAGVFLFQNRSNEAVQVDEQAVRYAAAVMANYFWTGKTTLHLELGGGQDTRTSENPSSREETLTYVMLLGGAKYQPSAKLSLDLAVGVSARQGGLTERERQEGLRPAFRLTANWEITEKTAASLYFGFEGADLVPQFNFALSWQPRVTTAVSLSLYQRSGITEFDIGNDELYRGVLVALSQRAFSRITLNLSAGLEQTEHVDTGSSVNRSDDAFTFLAASGLWSIKEWASLELYYRTSEGGSGTRAAETRSGVRLNLTF